MSGNVIELPKKDPIPEPEAYRRWLALEIATQLPRDAQEARKVLVLVGGLLEGFLNAPTPF